MFDKSSHSDIVGDIVGDIVTSLVSIKLLTAIAPPQRLGAPRVFDHAEEAGQAVSEAAQDGAVPGGGGASPG